VRAAHRARSAQHYWAFLSYAHEDSETAEWLHQALEDFRVPPSLVGKLTDPGPVPARLTPVFRDRHELSAASDLGEEIEQALAGSRHLVVLCSPAAATSHWTNEEVDCFKRLRPEGCVLAAIVDGEPFASDMPGRERDECFPPALRQRYDRRGRPTDKRAEPIAADLREGRDGRRLGLLKIVAGMLGVRLDDLVQRETLRRHRRLAWLTAASLAGMAVTSTLAVVAIQARDAARDERREADGLIGFMLGDLRTKLEPLGRLDVLDSVAARALAYYEKQDTRRLSDDALAQRSKALTLMGEMAQMRGDLDGALVRYREAMTSTEEGVRRSPDNPKRLFDHAQNLFWVGYIDYQRGRLGEAERAFRQYRALADRMIALAPANKDYKLERIYADTNLGTVLIDQRHFNAAAEVFQSSLDATQNLVASTPANRDYKRQLAVTLAYLADAREGLGQLDEAIASQRQLVDLLGQMLGRGEDDADLSRKELGAHRSLSRLLASRGDVDGALAEARRATALANQLIKRDPQNAEWIQSGAAANAERAGLELAVGRPAEATATTNALCDAAAHLLTRDRTVWNWRALQQRCLLLRAQIALREGANASGLAFAQKALAGARAFPSTVDRQIAIIGADLVLSDALRANKQAGAARGALEDALAAFPKGVELMPRDLAQQALVLRRLGRDASAIETRLTSIGYRHPEYLQNRS
jgi:tetratricopeptide (TPR) repeat protein